MLPHRRFGNRVLTRWVRWLTRRRDLTDGQSGWRAFSPAAGRRRNVHDYNYAQVLTLDLLAKGFRYTEVPIRYSFRDTGTSFVRLGRYLSRVVPAVHRELNSPNRRPVEVAAIVSRERQRGRRAPPGTTDELVAATGKSICFSPEYVGETTFAVTRQTLWAHDQSFQIIGGEPEARHCVLATLT